jgi:hypothetical protein
MLRRIYWPSCLAQLDNYPIRAGRLKSLFVTILRRMTNVAEYAESKGSRTFDYRWWDPRSLIMMLSVEPISTDALSDVPGIRTTEVRGAEGASTVKSTHDLILLTRWTGNLLERPRQCTGPKAPGPKGLGSSVTSAIGFDETLGGSSPRELEW